MKVVFFNGGCKKTTNEKRFGICDDTPPPSKPAYIDTTDSTKWIAIVKNDNEFTVDFYAIDNCIDIRRPDGTMEKRCDAMLHYNSKIIFVELKDRASKGWVAKGRKQLTVVFNTFKSQSGNVNFVDFEFYICNKQKPLAQSGHMGEIQKFRNETGHLLKLQQLIDLK